MELIRLNRSHKNDFKKINDITEKELENPEFFIGFFTEDEIDNILENSKKDDKTIFYGYFNEKELVSISGLFLDIEDLKYEFKLICYGKQQVGDCLIIIDGNERCFMGNYMRFFWLFWFFAKMFLYVQFE